MKKADNPKIIDTEQFNELVDKYKKGEKPDLHNVVAIDGWADFEEIDPSYFPNLKYVSDNVFMSFYSKSLGNIVYIGGTLDLNNSKATNFDKLVYIGDDVYFDDTELTKNQKIGLLKLSEQNKHPKNQKDFKDIKDFLIESMNIKKNRRNNYELHI